MPMDGQRMTKNRTSLLFKKWFDVSRERALSLLFPPRCIVCDEILTPEERERGIHLVCESKLYPVKGAVCMHCGRPFGRKNSPNQNNKHMNEDAWMHLQMDCVREYCGECCRKGYVLQNESHRNSAITQGKSLYLYRGAVKTTMYRFKYANKREYASFFAQKAVEQYGDWIRQAEVIVPVPMYLPKQKLRGYNQAETFAKALSRRTGIPVDKQSVYRVKNTTPQKELSHKERKNNLENAFQKGQSIVQYSHILVVDDIYTTGYTAQAVARELKKQGGRHIQLLSICIGGYD